MKINLCIIYNHRYESNIPKLEQYYADKFHKVYHLMPFYQGEKENVIAVFESSHNFEGFINQAFYRLTRENDDSQWLFLGDDCLLNPSITEDNFSEYFLEERKGEDRLHNFGGGGQKQQFAFIKELVLLTRKKKMFYIPRTGLYITAQGFKFWHQLKDNNHGIYIKDSKGCLRNSRFIAIEDQLPAAEQVKSRFVKFGITKKEFADSKAEYPLLLSFSDIMFIPNKDFKEFAYWCGVFAAANLHVELACPTAMALSCDNIVQEKDLAYHGQQNSFDNKEVRTLADVEKLFDEKTLYIHPIKMSKINL